MVESLDGVRGRRHRLLKDKITASKTPWPVSPSRTIDCDLSREGRCALHQH